LWLLEMVAEILALVAGAETAAMVMAGEVTAAVEMVEGAATDYRCQR